MSEFEQVYDKVSNVARGCDLFTSFADLSNDRERTLAVLALAPLRDYCAPINYAEKCAKSAEKFLREGGNERDARRACSMYSAAIRFAPDVGPLLQQGFQSRSRLLHDIGEHEAALRDALRGLERAHNADAVISCMQLAASCHQHLRRWEEAEQWYKKALDQVRAATYTNAVKAKLAAGLARGFKQATQKTHPMIASEKSKHLEESQVSLLPELDYGVNNQLSSCSSAINMKFSQEKGRHLVANRDIAVGAPTYATHTLFEKLVIPKGKSGQK